jgi:hypothetical protein
MEKPDLKNNIPYHTAIVNSGIHFQFIENPFPPLKSPLILCQNKGPARHIKTHHLCLQGLSQNDLFVSAPI